MKRTTTTMKKGKIGLRRPNNSSCALPQGEAVKSLNGVTVPSQFFLPATESHAHWSGSRRLMLSVLQDALATWHRHCQDPSTRGQRLFREIQEWFWSADEGWLYTFENVCKHLDLDPDSIRERLVSRQVPRARERRPLLRRRPSTSPRTSALAA